MGINPVICFALNRLDATTSYQYSYHQEQKRSTLLIFGRLFVYDSDDPDVAKEGVFRAALCRGILSTALADKRLGNPRGLSALANAWEDMSTLEPLRDSPPPEKSPAPATPNEQSVAAAPLALRRCFPTRQPGSDVPIQQSDAISSDSSRQVASERTPSTRCTRRETIVADPSLPPVLSPTRRKSNATKIHESATQSNSSARPALCDATHLASMQTMAFSSVALSPTPFGPYPKQATSSEELELYKTLLEGEIPRSALERLHCFLSLHFAFDRSPASYQTGIAFDCHEHSRRAVMTISGRRDLTYAMFCEHGPVAACPTQSPDAGRSAEIYYREELARMALERGCLETLRDTKTYRLSTRALVDQLILKYVDLSSLPPNAKSTKSGPFCPTSPSANSTCQSTLPESVHSVWTQCSHLSSDRLATASLPSRTGQANISPACRAKFRPIVTSSEGSPAEKTNVGIVSGLRQENGNGDQLPIASGRLGMTAQGLKQAQPDSGATLPTTPSHHPSADLLPPSETLSTLNPCPVPTTDREDVGEKRENVHDQETHPAVVLESANAACNPAKPTSTAQPPISEISTNVKRPHSQICDNSTGRAPSDSGRHSTDILLRIMRKLSFVAKGEISLEAADAYLKRLDIDTDFKNAARHVARDIYFATPPGLLARAGIDGT